MTPYGIKIEIEAGKVEESIAQMEDKQRICDLLLPALQATRGLNDLKDLVYCQALETVLAVFPNGNVKHVNVAADSGTAMIKDIMRGIV